MQVTKTSIIDAVFKYTNTLNFYNPVSIIKAFKCFLFWNFLLADGDHRHENVRHSNARHLGFDEKNLY